MPSVAELRRMARERGVLRDGSPKLVKVADDPARFRVIYSDTVYLTLPWSALQTGNRFFGLASKAYRAAKAKAVAQIESQLPAITPVFPDGAVRIVVTLYMPNEHRRDVLNYAKLICDAMSSRVYRDDSQIHDAHFLRMVDVDRPRADITIQPLTTIGARGKGGDTTGA